MSKLLEVKHLYSSFSSLSKKIHAVRNVSFTLEEGTVLGILGESGSGKTAMAKSLTRLLSNSRGTIDSGKIFYQGENLLDKSEKEMRKIRGKEIGMIFQDPMNSLNPTMKIGKQIVEGYRLHYPKISKHQAVIKGIELLTEVGIPQPKSRFNQYPHELSGGMRQRIMIAIAMIPSPRILIADEPTTALDVTIQAQILGLLQEIKKKENMSIILITHDFSIVAGFCNHVLVMYAGEIIENATVDQLFASPKHPYTKRLIRAIPRIDLPARDNLFMIRGAPPDLSLEIKGCSFAPRCPYSLPICKEKSPPSTSVEQGHSVNCWLQG
jgi:oligopeptide transport system ATP-binding protein